MSPNYTISSCELDCSPVKTTELTKCRTVLALLALLCTLGTHGQAPTPDPFVTTWVTEAANETITIPTNPEDTYNYTVKWEDGGTEETFTGDATHTYVTAGTHMVSISGIFPRIYFNDETDTDENADKIRTIENWGDIAWASMNGAFAGCSNLRYMATDVPNLSDVTDMANMFAGATAFDGDISGWDVSKVNNMMGMFVGASLFNGNISNWDVSKVINMFGMFSNASAFNGDISDWDVSEVIIMSAMFSDASLFNGDISDWNVSKVTNMFAMFTNANAFNQDLSDWNVSKVTSMQNMFFGASLFNGDISGWNVSKVSNMSAMFGSTSAFNGDISNWDVSKVTEMQTMFFNASAFNGDISGWNVSMVTNMQTMFFGATAFDGNLGNWDVSMVTNFTSFLFGAELSSENYDALLVGWNKLSLTAGLTFNAGNSQYTSAGAAARTTIDTGDDMWTIADDGEVDMTVSFAENDAGTTVTDIDGATTATMYALATPTAGNRRDDDNLLFRIDNMGALSFMSAPDFENPQDARMNNIYAAEVTVTTGTDVMKVTVSVSVTNFNEFSPVASMISNLSLAKDFGTRLIDLSGTFTDGDRDMLTLSVSTSSPSVVTATIAPGGTTLTLTEEGLGESVITVTAMDGNGGTGSAMFTVTVSLPFVTTWKTDMAMESITIPTTGGGYNYTVNWGDGMEDTEVTGNVSHTYATANTYRVSITGDFPRIYFNDVTNTPGANADKILTIEKWGNIAWTSMNSAFEGCTKLTSAGTDLPDLSRVTDMADMFTQAIAFNVDIGNWDVSTVNNMKSMFASARAFNQDLSNWNVSMVDNMSNMFADASLFNGDISNWDVSSVTNMFSMFASTRAFNQDLSDWNVENVGNFSFFLSSAELSPGNYDALLIGWNALTLQSGLTFDAGNSRYTPAGKTARAAIIRDDGWMITDGGLMIVATFAENGTGTVTDIDGGVMASYALAAPTTGNSNDDDNALFNIEMSTGVLTFMSSPDFESPADANGNNIYAVEVTVTEGSNVTKVTVSVSVTNVMGEPPVVAIEISNQSLDTGFGTHVIELADTFTDDDGDDLMLTVMSANVTVVTAAIAPGTTMLTLTEVGGGSSEITVTAMDGNGGMASDKFTVKVNKPPTVVATGISDLSRMEGFGTEDIDFSGTFTDPDAGDVLTFSVMSADEGVVTATIAPGTTTLTIMEVGPGSSVITVTATDGRGGMASDMFTVTVEMVTGVAEARSLRAYPNPGSESLTVEMEGTWNLVRIYDFTGRHIHVPVREQGPKKVVLDISGLTGGIYLVKVSGGGHSTVHRLVVE